MQKNMSTLRELAKTKPKKQPEKKAPTSKELRAVEIKAIGDWLIWIEIAEEQCINAWLNKKKSTAILSEIKNHFTGISELQDAMAIVMLKYLQLTSHKNYLDHALAKIYQKLSDLEKIEQIKNKGGRKPQKELYEIAYAKCLYWYEKKGVKPSGSNLSKMVDYEMTLKKGAPRKDGNLYLSVRSANDYLNQWQPPISEFNRQELVTPLAN
jgi:hypothetical protein